MSMYACKNCPRSGACQQGRRCHIVTTPRKSDAIGWLIVVITSLIAATLPVIQHVKP